MEIKVNTGLVDYDLGGKVTVSFNPTDVGFGGRLYDAITALADVQDETMPEKDPKKAIEWLMEKDRKGREIIDNLFEKEVCKPLYDTISIFAFADGLPLWANLLLAIMDQMNDSVVKQRAEVEKRIKKYTAKYEK